jgi:zinc protease
VPIDRLKSFYQKYYQPDNAVLLIAGKFDPAKTLQLIADKFSPIPRPARVLQPIYTVEPTQDGERTVQVRRVGDTQLIIAGYHIPAASHPDFATLELMSQILADTPSGRLYKALVDSKKATSIGGFNLQLHDPGMALFIAQASKDQPLETAREGMIQTIESFGATAPTAEEIERARVGMLKQIDLALNSPDQVGVELSEWIALGDWRLFFLHRDRIKKVTAADVQRVAANYLKPTNRTIATYVPTDKVDRAEIPPAPDIASMVRDYKGVAAVAEGEAFDPSPANIESRAVRATGPGGLKMVFVPKETRGDAVVATMTLRIGDEKSLMNRGAAGEFTGRMLMRGTQKHTRQQIQDELDKLKARAFVSGGPTSINAFIETTRENLSAVMRLVAEILREPSFPEAEFEKLKQESITAIESQRNEPQAAALIAFNRHMNPYPKEDVRYAGTLEEELADIRALKLDDVKKFYADFYGASTGELAVVGDFEQKQIESLATELFGAWKSPRPFARLATGYKEIPAVNLSFETPDKTNAVFFAGLRINVRDDHPDYPALVLGNYMLGGGFLNSRLATRLRQKDGLSYQVGSGLNVSPLDSNGQFTAFAIYAPQNAAKLEAGFKEELERMLKEGFTAEEVEAAKKGYLQSRQVGRAQDRELASRLSAMTYYGRTLAWDIEMEKKIAALTPEQINGAMRRHIDLAKISIFKAGDFAKAAPKQ